MRRLIFKFISDNNGATAIEYALIAAGIALVIVTAVNAIGEKLNTSYTAVNNALP
ncbi:Flp family type IVb pilin [Rhodopseudomonas telluris]|uniref:Flp family type IVb pilin n=1 Tax=Rhodopseudomonas telluris TaxID=644215 RepID=A0ABV6EST5_9BRAD